LATIAVLTHVGLTGPAYAATGTFVQYTYGGPAGSRPYYVYTPAGYAASQKAPLVVMLHGCTQYPVDFANGTQMNALADSKGFIVVYPQQTLAYDSMYCWHWDETAHQSRGSGEPAIIAGITQTVIATTARWNIDPDRVYVAGLSAGAAMSVVMAATYPDLYAAMGASAGLEYKAVTNGASGSAVIYGGPDPVTQGQAAYAAMGSQARVVPVIVFHGTQDTTVYPINGDQIVRQWMETDRLASSGSYSASLAAPSTTVTGRAPGTYGRAYTVRVWNDAGATAVQEYWTVTGMGHDWSGGSTTGSHADPNGPSASQNIYAFFMAHARSAPPAVVPAAPAGLTATSASSSQINLTWSPSGGATSYQVHRSPDGATGWTQMGVTSAVTYSDAGLTPSTTYYYRVIATNVVGASAPSNASSSTTMLSVTLAPQGTWVGTYGLDGYALLGWNGGGGDLVALGPASLVVERGVPWQWRTTSTAVRDLQSPTGSTRRATALYDTTQLRLRLSFATAYAGTLHLYALDASTNTRREVITVNDGSGPRTAPLSSAFDQGAWIHAPISVAAGGSVTITVDQKAGYNAVLSGIFLR
jgi:poly(hydroxyalkanoate) depolymerase family esterase